MNAYLLLANGMVFAGQSVGAEGVTVGDVVNFFICALACIFLIQVIDELF